MILSYKKSIAATVPGMGMLLVPGCLYATESDSPLLYKE